MESKRLIPRFGIGDIIVVRNTVYVITSILPGAFDLAPEAPFMYGMVVKEVGWEKCYYGKETFVWEGHLESISEHDVLIWKILYGD